MEIPGCSLCMGNQARVRPGTTVISTSTRNFDNRLGDGTKVYLGSTELTTISALLGNLPTVQQYFQMVAVSGKTEGNQIVSQSIKKICLLDNPKSGSTTHANRVKVLFHLIEDFGYRVTWEELTSLEQTLTVMDAHIEAGCDLFVVSGGDGTVRSVAHHLTGRRIPLLIFPAGNENLLATELGLQATPSEALKVIRQGRYKDIDVAQVNGMTCIAVAGVGLDAAIVHHVHRARKGHINKLNYVWAALQIFFTYRHTEIDIRIDDRKIDCVKSFALIGNIPRYGGGFNVFKDAAYDDGFLDITVFRCSNFLQLTALFISLVTGKLEKSSRVEFYKGKNIVMSSPRSTLLSQIDGDPGPPLPLTLQVVPEGLRLLVP